MLLRYSLAVLTSWLFLAGAAQSATYTLTPTLAGAFTPDFIDPVPNFDPATYVGPPVVLQIDYMLDYQGTEGTFGAIVFDIELQGLSENQVAPGWQAHNPGSIPTAQVRAALSPCSLLPAFPILLSRFAT